MHFTANYYDTEYGVFKQTKLIIQDQLQIVYKFSNVLKITI